MKRTWIILFFLPLMTWAIEPTLSHIITPQGETNPLSDNKKIIKAFWNAFAEKDTKGMNAHLSPNYIVKDSTLAFDTDYSKYDAFSKNMGVRVKSLHTALPEFKLEVLEMLGEGNKVLSRVQISGVQKGQLFGVEPTNKPVVIRMFVIFTINGGKITHINELWNEFGVMKQMGYIIL